MGDLLLALPAVKLLRDSNPQARITLFCDDANFELANLLGLFDEVIKLNALRNRYVSLIFGLIKHRGRFDLYLPLKGGYGRQNSLAAVILGSAISVSYVRDTLKLSYLSEKWITDRMLLSEDDYQSLHYSTQVANLVLQTRTSGSLDSVYWPSPSDFKIEQHQKGPVDCKKMILIPIVAESDPRMPSVNSWVKLLKMIEEADQGRFDFVLCCRSADVEVANLIKLETGSTSVEVITPQDIETLCNWVARSDICLGGDGGTIHIAAALRKQIFLFIASDKVSKWLPLSDQIVWYSYDHAIAEVDFNAVFCDLIAV